MDQKRIYSYQNKVPHSAAKFLAVSGGILLILLGLSICAVTVYVQEWWILIIAAIPSTVGIMLIVLLNGTKIWIKDGNLKNRKPIINIFSRQSDDKYSQNIIYNEIIESNDKFIEALKNAPGPSASESKNNSDQDTRPLYTLGDLIHLEKNEFSQSLENSDLGRYFETINLYNGPTDTKPEFVLEQVNLIPKWLQKDIDPPPKNKHIEQAKEYMEERHILQALFIFDRLLDKSPHYLMAYEGRALASWYNGDLNGALKDYSYILAVKPEIAGLYLRRAGVYENLGNFDLALKDIESYIRLESRDGVAHWVFNKRRELRQKLGYGSRN